MPSTQEQLKEQLELLGLDTQGLKPTLKNRLNKHLKKHPEACAILAAHKKNSGESVDQTVETSTPETLLTRDGDSEADKVTDTTATTRTTSTTTTSTPPENEVVFMKESQPKKSAAAEPVTKGRHKNSRYDYYLCFDVEATCESDYGFEYPNEIIEFPIVMLDGNTFEVVDEFHTYVKPTYQPILSDFCVQLTGIKQEWIDDAPTFTEALVLFQDWLTKHGILVQQLKEFTPLVHEKKSKSKTKKNQHHHHNNNSNKRSNQSSRVFGATLDQYDGTSASQDFEYGPSKICFVTDGPFDIRDFVSKQCILSGIARPSYFSKSYIDVRTLFREFFELPQWLNLEGMVRFLGEEFEGRQHSGICDARMVAMIAKRLAEGVKVELDPQGRVVKARKEMAVDSESSSFFATITSAFKTQPKRADRRLALFKEGCVINANKTLDQQYWTRHLSFETLERLEGRKILRPEAAFSEEQSEVAEAVAVAVTEAETKAETKVEGEVEVDVEVEAKSPQTQWPTPPPEPSSSSSEPTLTDSQENQVAKENFLSESRFAALMIEEE
ncbi:hypothetical protein BGW38_005767 [Lunasporangiospora selenospora]|uniref:SAP domain-containing protein n=1 Tax=Lunasporangiospora selenospora TaxID=979761 RepID=A0A9P6FNC6_9FUNG|nr:hypothetical protein BGW38_005767 [Lunasporangiospora selenospora]